MTRDTFKAKGVPNPAPEEELETCECGGCAPPVYTDDLPDCKSPYCECMVGECANPGFRNNGNSGNTPPTAQEIHDALWEKAWDDLNPQRGS